MTFGTPVKDLINENKRFELVQLGASGSGKTTRTLTATQFGKVLVLDFDGKIQGALREFPAAVKDQIKIENLFVENVRDMSYDELDTFVDSLVKAKGSDFSTIVVDTFTNLTDVIYKSVFPTEADLFKANAMQMWGRVKHRTDNIITKLQTLPANIIINCHVDLNEAGVPTGASGQGGYKKQLGSKQTDTHFLAFERGLHRVKLKNSTTPPVNTSVAAEYVDDKGYATEFGLKILADYAFVRSSENDQS